MVSWCFYGVSDGGVILITGWRAATACCSMLNHVLLCPPSGHHRYCIWCLTHRVHGMNASAVVECLGRRRPIGSDVFVLDGYTLSQRRADDSALLRSLDLHRSRRFTFSLFVTASGYPATICRDNTTLPVPVPVAPFPYALGAVAAVLCV